MWSFWHSFNFGCKVKQLLVQFDIGSAEVLAQFSFVNAVSTLTIQFINDDEPFLSIANSTNSQPKASTLPSKHFH
jgi:hypothetical protein